MMATIKTGPHSYARGELAETLPDGRARISLANGEERVGPVVLPYVAAHSDDQDHDMTPLMERRDG